MRKTSKLSGFLPVALLKKMRSRQTEAELLSGIWHEIVGQEIAGHSTPVSYKREVLTVLTDNANWASKLRHSLPAVISQCRKQKNLKLLNKIKIKIGHKNNLVLSNANPVPRVSRISTKAAAQILESAKHIEDETLKASLERLGGNFQGNSIKK